MGSEKEYCDLYDENRNIVGKVNYREYKLGPGEYLLAVGIWVFNSRNEILLTKRHPDKNFAPNLGKHRRPCNDRGNQRSRRSQGA